MISSESDFQAQFSVSRETLNRLAGYLQLLERWNLRINLVSPKTITEAWSRHIADSAQLWALSPKVGKWVDLGSGAGFPGLVIAILAAEATPEVEVTLIESDQRKAAFLATVSRSLGVPVTILDVRIERAPPQAAAILSARALAPLESLLGMTEKHRDPAGVALFLKGETVHTELATASKRWRFAHRIHPSLTESRAAIVEIGAIDRV